MFVYMPERYLKNIQRFGANFECRNGKSLKVFIIFGIKSYIGAIFR